MIFFIQTLAVKLYTIYFFFLFYAHRNCTLKKIKTDSRPQLSIGLDYHKILKTKYLSKMYSLMYFIFLFSILFTQIAVGDHQTNDEPFVPETAERTGSGAMSLNQLTSNSAASILLSTFLLCCVSKFIIS